MRRLEGNRPDLMRPYSLHLPSLDESSNTDAAPRSRYGSLRWHNSNTPSRPSSASYHQDPFASNEWSRSATSKRDSVQSSRSSLLPQPRRLSNSTPTARTLESSMSSPSVLTSPNSSIDAQSRIPVPVQRRGTNQNKNFYVVGRKPVHDPGIEVAPRPPPATQANESPTPSPGTISAKAFRRSVASAHSIMQLDANASTLSFHSTASGGVGVRPRSKSHSSQIPQAKGKARRVVSESAATALGGDGAEETESELPYHISMPAYDGIQHQHPPWLDRANDQGTPSISDFGEAGSFFREIMDSRDDGERDVEPQQGSGARLCSRLIEELGSQDSSHNQITQASRASVGATNVCDTEPAVLLQAMANETQRMLDERYGALPESSALPIPLSPLELDLTRANTTKSGTSTVPQPKRVPPPAIPSPLLTPKPKISQSSMSQVSSPQSSNFVRISRRTPSSSPLSHQGNGVSKKHKAKQPSLLGRLFSPTRPKSTPVSQPLRAAPRPAWITGTFVIDPTLRVPGGILSVSSMLSPTRNSAYMANMGAGAGGEKKNLVLEVQNGGIDVTVKLVPQACGEKGGAVSTKIELNLLGVSSPARSGLDREAKDRRTRKNGKGCEAGGKDEVYPIVARIDAPNPRPPLYLIASTVASPSIEHAQKHATPNKLDAKDYVLVEAPISPPTSPRQAKRSLPSTNPNVAPRGSKGSDQRPSRSSTGELSSPKSGTPESSRVSRSSTTGKRLSKASTATNATARPYHLPSSLVTNTSQSSAEGMDDGATSTLPFPAPGQANTNSSSAAPIPRGLPAATEDSPDVDPKRIASTSPIHLALPTTFRGPLSVTVLSVSEEGGVGAHVHMSPAVQRMAVLLQETSGDGEGRQVWFVGGLGLSQQEGGKDECGGGDEDSIFSEDEDENDAIFSGVWNMGGEVAKTRENEYRVGAGGKPNRMAKASKNKVALGTSTSKPSRLPRARKTASGRDAPTPTPRSSESDSAGHGERMSRLGSDERGERRRTGDGDRVNGDEGGYSPQEEWKGDRVDLLVGRGKIFLRFWDECVPGAGAGLGTGTGPVVGSW